MILFSHVQLIFESRRARLPKMDQQTGEYKASPFIDSQKSLTRAMFAKKERDEFFTEAYADILVDLFTQWLMTEPHCQKEREYLYHVAMGPDDKDYAIMFHVSLSQCLSMVFYKERLVELRRIELLTSCMPCNRSHS